MQPLKKLAQFRVYLLTLLEACLVALCFVAAMALLVPLELSLYLEYEGGWQRVAAISASYLVASYLFNFFRQIQAVSRLAMVLRLVQLTGMILIIQAVLSFINPELSFPPFVGSAGLLFAVILLIPWRLYIRPVLWNAFGARRVLAVGGGPGQTELAEAFTKQPFLGSEIVGSLVTSDSDAVVEPVLGRLPDFMKVVQKTSPDYIVVSGGITDKVFLKALMSVKASGITVHTVGQAWEELFGRIYSRDLDPYAVIYRNELDSRPSSLALQSIYNNLLGLTAVVISLPFMLVLTILLTFARKGPVFCKLACVGLHGVPFNMYRFRRTAGGGFLNHILVRFRLEGLPQIVNVVRGEVALIGPRAERIEFQDVLNELVPFYNQRTHVKPGIFGWSQLHCDGLPYEDTLARIEYDLYYIKHISLLLDAHVVIRGIRWLLSDPYSAGADH